MINKIKDTIEKYNMIEKGDKILVGLSGGVDSVCLLQILLSMKKEYMLEIHAIHIHHGLRGEFADKDAFFCKKLCEKNDVKLKVVHENVTEVANAKKMSLEEAGRFVRYNAFNEETRLKHINKIALAHHKNDVAETVLMNIIRGSGTSGLKGISYVRGNIIRPLLEISKKEIEIYCNQNNHSYCTDETNLENIYTRNKIRNELIPHIEENYNEKFLEHLANLRKLSLEDEEFINGEAEKVYNENIITKSDFEIIIDFHKIEKHSLSIRRRIIRLAFFEISKESKNFSFAHVEKVLDLMKKQSGKELDMPYKVKITNQFGNLCFSKKEKTDRDGEKFTIKINEVNKVEKYNLIISAYETYKCHEKNFENNCKKICTTSFSYDKMIKTDNLMLRNRQAGDKIYFNSIAGNKKLKDLFSEKKIPICERNNIPVLAIGNEVVCIFLNELIFSDYYRSTEEEKKLFVDIWEEKNE